MRSLSPREPSVCVGNCEVSHHPMRSLLRNHGLSIALLGIFLVTFLGQILTGQADYNHEREQEHEAPLSLGGYLQSAHFLEAATENWESEFLQMGTYVLATAWLY